MEINSTNNSFIKSLKKEKAKNRFLLFLDTPILVKEAINHNLKIHYILINKTKKFDFVRDISTDKVIFVNESVITHLSNVENNAGIIGVFEFNKKEYENPQDNYLVLDNVQDAGNVGTIIRSAAGANFKSLYLLDCASVTNEKVIRSTAGAIFKVNIFEMSKQEFVSNFNKENLYVADMNGENVFESHVPLPLGIVLGNEGKGVSQKLRELAKGKVLSVPMEKGLESLNVAVSGSILMYTINFGGKNVRS